MSNKNPKRKKAVGLIIIVIILIIISVVSFIPDKINKEYSAIMYRLGDPDYSENLIIKIDGEVSSVFGKRTFKGIIDIGDNQMSFEKLQFDRFGRASLFNYDKTAKCYLSYGDFVFQNMATGFTIRVLERIDDWSSSWSYTDGLMISAPAGSRAEALDISSRLMKDFLGDKELK